METPAETQPEQETAAPVTDDSATSTETEGQAPKVEEVKKDPPQEEPDWFRKRIDEITAKRYAEQREADQRYQETARERDYLRSQLQQQAPKETEKPKTLADFEYDESKYQGYILDMAEKRAEAAAKRVRSEEQSQVQAERRMRKFKEREVSFEKETKDYREVAHYAPISDDVAEIIQDLEAGPELAYYLGKNKDIALHLNDLPKTVAAVELGRIDARLSAEKAAKKAALDAAKAAKAVSKAPEPTPTIEGSGEPSSIDPSTAEGEKLSDAEWTRRREKQIQRQRRR